MNSLKQARSHGICRRVIIDDCLVDHILLILLDTACSFGSLADESDYFDDCLDDDYDLEDVIMAHVAWMSSIGLVSVRDLHDKGTCRISLGEHFMNDHRTYDKNCRACLYVRKCIELKKGA